MKKVIIKNLQATPITYQLFIKKDQKLKGEKENEPLKEKGIRKVSYIQIESRNRERS
jgi:hypothetical protein